MSAIAHKVFSIQEYLRMEKRANDRHEYYNGEVYSMAGATLQHDRIHINLISIINPFLKGKSCSIFSNDIRVHIPENTLFTYPDAFIVCGKPELLQNELDTVLNPSVIFEILSRSTRKYDKLEKFSLYRSIPSFTEYILIDSEKIEAEHYLKNSDNTWTLSVYNQLEQNFAIEKIKLSVKLADLYDGVQL
jgi:Uma2 family endonuclease